VCRLRALPSLNRTCSANGWPPITARGTHQRIHHEQEQGSRRKRRGLRQLFALQSRTLGGVGSRANQLERFPVFKARTKKPSELPKKRDHTLALSFPIFTSEESKGPSAGKSLMNRNKEVIKNQKCSIRTRDSLSEGHKLFPVRREARITRKESIPDAHDSRKQNPPICDAGIY
jgi:hypothetical protein